MAKHEIEVTISPTGEVEFHLQGLKGKGCLKILEEFERALGKAKGAPKGTAEMYETEKVTGKVGR